MRWRVGDRSGRRGKCAESGIIPTWPHQIHSSTTKMTLVEDSRAIKEYGRLFDRRPSLLDLPLNTVEPSKDIAHGSGPRLLG